MAIIDLNDGTWVIEVTNVKPLLFNKNTELYHSFFLFLMERALAIAGYKYEGCKVSYRQKEE
jgi:hypothetical protein